MRKATPDPNIRYDLLLTLLNRGNEARWREHFRDALKKSERILIRHIRSAWQPNKVIQVNPVPSGKIGLDSEIPSDLRGKMKRREQWHRPTDHYGQLKAIADLLIKKNRGQAVAEAFNQLTVNSRVWAVPQVCWQGGRFIPAWVLRPGGVTDLYLTDFADLLLSQWASRLRRCFTCQLYFIDQTRNGAKLRCSPQCTARYWTRLQRRNAGHAR